MMTSPQRKAAGRRCLIVLAIGLALPVAYSCPAPSSALPGVGSAVRPAASAASVAENCAPEEIDRAVTLIDSEKTAQLAQAKAILERLIAEKPRCDEAYVQLARVALRENLSPQGLHQAEILLQSALQVRPDSANAKIVLGYVYVHENRFAEAEELFVEVSKTETGNPWLWANWGQLFVAQGKFDEAIIKYREVIAQPMTHDTYDRARVEAYRHLIALLQRRKDFDGMEALYKQRLAEFGPGSCYGTDYALFVLQERGDTEQAIELARGALKENCEGSKARQILGLAEYVRWVSTSGEERTEALNQARVFLPPGPKALYLLATSERTLPAVKELIAAGEPIDQTDSDKLTALAYALRSRDLPAARRLLALGARPDIPVGHEEVPVALMPVMEGNTEAVRVLQQFGADYSQLRYQGATAFDLAKGSRNHSLLEVLGQGRPVL